MHQNVETQNNYMASDYFYCNICINFLFCRSEFLSELSSRIVQKFNQLSFFLI